MSTISNFENISSNDSAYNSSDYDSDDTDNLMYGMEEIIWEPHNLIAITLSVIAITANVLSLFATLHVRGGLTSHYRLVVSLAVSDILISTSVMLHLINTHLNPRSTRSANPMDGLWQDCAFVLIKALNTTSLNISLLNLMGMAIDHYLAVLRPLHYSAIMSVRRGSIMIAVLWVIAIICGFSDFLSGLHKYHAHSEHYNYCDFVFETKYQDEYTVFAIAILCLFVMSYIYVRIYIEVHRIQSRPDGGREMQRNIKAVITTLFILGTFVLCWLPNCLFEIAMIIQVVVDRSKLIKLFEAYVRATKYLYDLLLLNCILDPIIYATRMRDVRHGYRKLFRSCRPRLDTCNDTSATLLNSRKGSRASQSLSGCILKDSHI